VPKSTTNAYDAALMASLAAKAAANPSGYRLRLGAVAVAGDIAHTLFQSLPWALPMAVGIGLLNSKLFYALGAIAFFILIWSFRPRAPKFGREISAADAPRLRSEIDRLRQQLEVSGDLHICLVDSFSASAYESRGLLGLLGTQRTLTLGIPLLNTLSREEVLAVVAHELGHFSRRHGRLGHWLYRAHAGWAQYLYGVEHSDAPLDKAASWYARNFLAYFGPRCFVYSRQCEYEADADAARGVGAEVVAAALTKVAVFAALWHEMSVRHVGRWQREYATPPSDVHARFRQIAAQLDPAEAQLHLESSLRAASTWHDTHPSLAERLRALGAAPQLAPSQESAGTAFFGDAWAALTQAASDEWARARRSVWAFEHARQKHMLVPLQKMDSAATRDWPAEEKLAHALALAEMEGVSALPLLRPLHDSEPLNKRVAFAHAAAMLESDDVAGVKLMEELARDEPAVRAMAFAAVVTFHARHGNEPDLERWSAWLRDVERGLGDALQQAFEVAEKRAPRVSTMPTAAHATLCEALASDSTVERAWLGECDASLTYAQGRAPAQLVCHFLVLVVNLKAAEVQGGDEESVARRYESALAKLLPPDQPYAVHTHLSTEPAALQYQAWPCVKPH
jgi:Zn-dependent protease with chaperone function